MCTFGSMVVYSQNNDIDTAHKGPKGHDMLSTARPNNRPRLATGVLASALITLPIALAACDMTEPADNPIDTTASVSAANNDRGNTGDWDETSFSGGNGTIGDNPDPADDPEFNTDSAMKEQAFLATINNNGITGEQNELIDIGYMQCLQISKGYTPQAMVYDWIESGDTGYPGYDGEDMSVITGAAIGALCPEHDSYLY